jgi:hypothetical protein
MEENLFKVEKIRRKKFDENRKEWLYLVKWQGYDSDESTWEPEENLCYIPQHLENFNKKWEAKQSLVKKKKEKKLENLVSKKRLKLLKTSIDAETSEIVRRADESLMLIDQQDEKENRARLRQIAMVFSNVSLAVGDVYSDVISKVVGLRDFKGRLFAAVLFKAKNEKMFQVGVVDLITLKDTCPKLLREFLRERVLS